ncbi:MAG: CDP-alcohol phosphatidyltransferase family protein [Gemmatimonadaceae bacterium]|nr:CDP-alcohol phosphatidyltransferase family protein [Gemmatimonadaceae bacterium]NUO95628.1 CDP-alcohol phosphatidyltransferase family protein [Gemmatimonadaceae bacterium]NUP56581.1 CDP-alcohol phosphatidyltransferase family protein [Gemmatimonadaceae bacterium]NUR33586.1 CDP-alcohol phosphatidyltransferase family protein [Gemmatimonadaceae bacterium]HWJ32387.1 CDP-alcohol phosphatidyltransferase family protein [Gaiellaceae bacterium]
MLDELLRPLKERMLTPAATVVGGSIHPIVVTLAAFVVGLGAAVAAALGMNGVGLTLWLVNRVLDGFDGTLARAQGAQSDVGGYVDIVLDFVVYAAIPLGLVVAAAPPERPALAVSALGMLSSFYVNAASWMYLAAILERRGAGAAARGELTTVTMPRGLIGGTETIVLYALFFALPRLLVPLFGLTTALVLVTVLQRLAWAARHL